MPQVLTEQQMNKIIKLAQERSQDSDFGHTMDHISLTVELSKHLAVQEGADENVCTIAAYLHDIAKNSSQSHGIKGAEEAREFLNGIGVPNPLINQVCYAISQHDNDLPKKTIEAKVLWDADKLQSVGPLGFARIFANRMIYVKKDVYYAIEQAKYWEDFFLERFYTDTGRSIAIKLHSFMEEFFHLCNAVKEAQLDQVLYDYSHTSVNLSQTSLSLHLLKRCRDNSIPRPHGRGFKYGSLKIPEEKSNMIAVLNEGQMKEIVSFAETRHKSGDLNHTMDHIHLTVDLSRYLASKENANSEVCIAAAYLHDIAKGDAAEEPKGDFAKLKKRSDGHGPNGAEEAKEFLKRLDAPDSFIEQVHYAISQHDNDLPKKTIEAKVLWDADKLQLVGPLGLARMFGYYMGYVKKDVYYAIEQARHWQDFFLERFCTETGYQLAGNLQQFMEQFFRLFEGAKNGQLYQPPLRQDLPHSKEHCHAHNIYHPAEDKRL